MVSMAERGRSADLVKVGCGRACGRACGRGSVELDRKAEIGPCGRANEGRGPPTAKTNPSKYSDSILAPCRSRRHATTQPNARPRATSA